MGGGGNARAAALLGLCLLIGLVGLGWQLGGAAIRFKEYERTVTVKGLAEREYPADIVIWPIQFVAADNDLAALYALIAQQAGAIQAFLRERGLEPREIALGPPAVVDKAAQRFGDAPRSEFRYSAQQTVTVYSERVDAVRTLMREVAALGRQGIVLSGTEYENPPEYLFTRLNAVKPEMIEEATTKAREVAEKFAADSRSRLGKIRHATQGQFTIEPRDRNNPHIKKVRVVSTVEYYLAD